MTPTKDRQPVRDLKKICHFRYLPPDTIFSPDKVTSVWVVPFTEDGEIVVAHLDRWWDIMGGHVQEWEMDFIETAKREAMEEGCVTIKEISLALVIESDYFWSSPHELTYMLCYHAMVDELLPFESSHESFARKVVGIEEFLKGYRGNKELVENMIFSCIDERWPF